MIMDKLPNFLIVGAAKSGTTTINYYLDTHKGVYMTTPKEPKYFSYKYAKYKGDGDLSYTKKKAIKTKEEYFKLFEKAISSEVVGEASVDNLFYHNLVIPDIKKILGDPKILIFLRHPVDRAISAYAHLIRDGREKLSFADALTKEKERLENGFEFIWGYKTGSFYYNQVKNYIDNFSNVKVFFFDDLINNPQKTLNQITEFLNIEDIEVQPKLKLNASGKSKNKLINNLISKDTKLRSLATLIVGKERAVKLKAIIQKKNTEPIDISIETKKELNNIFKQDIIQLEKLLNKNLSSWISKY